MKISILSVVLLCCGCLFGQNTYRFKNYTINDGLSQSAVRTIVQEESGALWLGTQDGLNRFDGQSFEIFNSDNTPGIENEYVHASLVGHNGNLWFGTANGLLEYHVKQERFRTFQPKGKTAFQVESMVQDADGNIWVASFAEGLFCWNAKTFEIEKVQTNLPTSRIQHVQQVSPNTLLIATEDKGLFLYHRKTKKTQKITSSSLPLQQVLRFNTSKQWAENTWLLASNQGLFVLDVKSGKIDKFLPELDRRFGLLEITDLWIENEQQFFLGTKNQGLITVETTKKGTRFLQSTTDLLQSTSLLYNEVNVLFKDKSGTFWVGTERGFGSFDPLNAGFQGVGASANLARGIPSPSVWCFGEDQEGKYLFVGTDDAITRIETKTQKFTQFYHKFTQSKQGSTDFGILSMYVISANRLLVGTTEGLYHLQIHSDQHYTFEKWVGKDHPEYLERTYGIVRWRDNAYLLATKRGVVLMDYSTRSIQLFEHNPAQPEKSIGAGVCRLVYRDKDGKIWFSTSSGGMYEWVEQEGKPYIRPFKWNEKIAEFSKDYVTTIFHQNDPYYWLGTMGSGLLRVDSRTGKVQQWNKKKGLPNNVVYGILGDKYGNLWLSTNKGISRFSSQTNRFTNYTEVDGLMSNEFNQGAFLYAQTGTMYFGGIYGYNYFRPETLGRKPAQVEVSFTKLQVDKDWISPGDGTKLLSQGLNYTTALQFGYRQRSFTLKFMAKNMSNPRLLSYKYILEGSEEGEVLLGNTNQIHFNALQPGDYLLKVYAKIGEGPWSTLPATMEISVAAPFWKTGWFWIAVGVFLSLAIVVYIRWRIDNERREQVRLEMKIAERTREIREQNIQIERQRRTIEEKKNNLEEQKRLLEIEKEKTEKLLKNIIPESTYEELKTKGKASARAYKTVSVMFTDFVGFTKIAEKMKPSDLVNELDIYFRKFDEIIVRNNLEKIKTIGDAYMCAGGVPVRNNTNPIDACLAALQIQDSMRILREQAVREGRVVFDLRLGINTGEVTAGVIGSEKLAYDIWGATVNQAQRMEMLGEPGKVTITGQTYKFVEPYFNCTFRGKARSKSQGFIDMYTVDQIKPELSIDGKGIFPNEKFKQIVNLHFFSSINYYKAERHIMKVLEKNLSPKLHYHSIAHTKDVVRAIERLALSEGVTDEGLFLLKSAATYHDAGFVESYEKNEPVGARMAEEILPKYGYSQAHIEQIKKLIFVTQIPHNPTDLLEEIICDADLDYLGRGDFHEIADKLRRELREHGKIDSDRKWDEIQVQFLTSHRYFTQTAKQTRDAKKAQNLQEIKERLERDEYVD